ncbi:hypothetical protein M8C21_032598, partial [Ambrosia artemisiifolia]
TRDIESTGSTHHSLAATNTREPDSLLVSFCGFTGGSHKDSISKVNLIDDDEDVAKLYPGMDFGTSRASDKRLIFGKNHIKF